jgi:hypothetical protein
MSLRLTLDRAPLAICRLSPDAALPPWAAGRGFLSVTRTPRELSIVCLESSVPDDVRASHGWVRLVLDGTFALDETGVLAALLAPLAAARVPVFALATFDTDHLLVPRQSVDDAVAALAAAGVDIRPSDALS